MVKDIRFSRVGAVAEAMKCNSSGLALRYPWENPSLPEEGGVAPTFLKKTRQKKSWVISGSGNFASE
jgi:hypothetical protein